ncbi:MAG: metallophosphoesterase [Chloroflexi bacterium]|nr:metallophosphoesterase [Chloroflexota bacterium]
MQKHGNTVCRFAVVADTHLQLVQGEGQALWSTHRLANARSAFVLQQLQRANPEFVIHLGDMIYPVPGMPEYGPTARLFQQMYGRLDCPVYTLPGNHDIGDKARAGMPADVVSQSSVALYHRHFGVSYRAFEHGGCRFMLLNNPILNSGLALEAQQRQWLEQELAERPTQRTFLFMHYPLYLRDPHESEHYDNVDEPGRAWLLDLIARYPVEAAFAAHVHNFFYNRYAAAELYTVPSVTFVRQDYSELFRVEPAADYGRNDEGKFGFFVVTVYERGHAFRLVRTAGQTLDSPGGGLPEPEALSPQVTDPRLQPFSAPVGVELRHPWAEVVDIPYNYILDELVRRKVRNDYPILALWDLGIERVRAPLADLLDPDVRARMQALRARGHAFTLFSLRAPQGAALEALLRHQELVDTLEVVLPWEEAGAALPRLQALREQGRFRICLSPLAVSRGFGASFDQYIRPGFRLEQSEALRAFVAGEDAPAFVDGYSFRVGAAADPWSEILGVAGLAAELGCRAWITVQLAADSEAGVVDDDLALAHRVAVATAAAAATPGTQVFLDTLVDMDRGYYVRHGLVDRRYNPRLPGRALRHLAAALPPQAGEIRAGRSQTANGQRVYPWETAAGQMALVFSPPGADLPAPPPLPARRGAGSAGTGICHDLIAGTAQPLRWRRTSPAADTLTVELERPLSALALTET